MGLLVKVRLDQRFRRLNRTDARESAEGGFKISLSHPHRGIASVQCLSATFASSSKASRSAANWNMVAVILPVLTADFFNEVGRKATQHGRLRSDP